MRSGFGRFAVELRLDRRISQKDFCELAGLSLSRVSNIEHQRCAVTDEVVGRYAVALNCTQSEEAQLKKLAEFSNSMRENYQQLPDSRPITAMFQQFADQLSPRAKDEIRKIIERETGEKVAELRFSSNQTPHKANRRSKRPTLSKGRLVDIALQAEKFRNRLNLGERKLEIGQLLDALTNKDSRFDYAVVEALPSEYLGAFAYITGGANGHLLVMEEGRFASALNGVYFLRHVIAHEIGHHVLHGELLKSESQVVLPPQELSRNACNMINSPRQIEQVIDTIEEAEAECFALFLLVPWFEFYKGTEAKYLAADFGEQPSAVNYFERYMKQPAVKEEFRRQLWTMGLKRHPIFSQT